MQCGHEKRTGSPKTQTVLKQTGDLKDESKTSWKEAVAFLLPCEPQECCSFWCWAWRMDRDPSVPDSNMGVLFLVLDLNALLVVNCGELSLCVRTDSNL